MKEKDVLGSIFKVLDNYVLGLDLSGDALYMMSRIIRSIKDQFCGLLLGSNDKFVNAEVYGYIDCLELIFHSMGMDLSVIKELHKCLT